VAVVALVTVPMTLLLILLLMPDRGLAGQDVVSVPATSDVPAAFVGSWTGSVSSPAYPGIAVATQLTLTEGRVGGVVGSVSGTVPGGTCTAALTLVGADASLLRLEAGLPTGPSCAAIVSTVELTARSAGSILYDESSALVTVTGVLHRG
jgi:hypothetical protein